MGGVVEEFLEGREKQSPSTQLRISPYGEVLTISTHDQILGGPSAQVFLGCRFPARDDYRMRMQQEAVKIGEVLASHGVVSRFAVDFLAWREAPQDEWELAALEINLRMGGTTHPYLAPGQFLTGGALDHDTGLFWSPTGHSEMRYVATDNLRAGQLPRPVARGSRRDPHRDAPALQPWHRVGRPLPPHRRRFRVFGKLGRHVAIADTPEDADAIYQRALAVLGRETTYRGE